MSFTYSEAATGGILWKKVFLKIWPYSQETICARFSFLIKFAALRPAILLKKTLWHSCFIVNFGKFLRKFFFRTHSGDFFCTDHLWATTFVFLFFLFLSEKYSKGNSANIQKQPSIGVLIKRCSENVQQIYRRTPIQKCDFNIVALYWNHTSTWVFSCKFDAYFRNTFL